MKNCNPFGLRLEDRTRNSGGNIKYLNVESKFHLCAKPYTRFDPLMKHPRVRHARAGIIRGRISYFSFVSQKNVNY